MTDTDCITHPDYWDCDCATYYIHHKSTSCPVCGAYDAEHHPDSRRNELHHIITKGELS